MNKFFYGGGAAGSKGSKRTLDETQDVKRHKRGPPQPTGPCWFCLSSEKVEKHLIVSVGQHCYLALAKGGLVSHHLMLLPIHHYQTSLDLEPAAVQELSKFKLAVEELFSASGQLVVFFERNFRTTHMQLHAVPVSPAVAERLGQVFKDAAEEEGLQLEEVPRRTELSVMVRPGQPFLLIQPPRGPSLLVKISSGYNMLFDRQVLACKALLNVPGCVNWKDCQGTPEEETSLRNEIRQKFAPFDFTAVESDDSDQD